MMALAAGKRYTSQRMKPLATKHSSWLITNCGELVTVAGPAPRRGLALREIGIIEDGAVLVQNGKIAATGPRRRIEKLPAARRARKLDAGGRVVMPGFVDSHTHLVFPASRAVEYEMRIGGASYEEIACAGGGIVSSVSLLRKAPAAALESQARDWLEVFAAHGTTTVEAKSGYALNLAGELKILEVQKVLARKQPLEIVSTFLGAHVCPSGHRDDPGAYIEKIVRQWLPRITRAGLAEYCDVFCDRGAFTVDQSRVLLTAAKRLGMGLRLHAEQLKNTGAGRLAAELGAASADHLDLVTDEDIRILAASHTVCTLLPGCSFHLGLRDYPPARKFIEAGAIVALATDFNPGTCPTPNMQMILSLACAQMRMTPAEAIAAATINAAYSLGRNDRIGSLETCKDADLAIFDVADHREIPYYFGVNHCCLVMKRGVVLQSRGIV
jgi:imidazolonepropionase